MDAPIANILVIDDEVGMREGCRRALTPQGFRVSTAENGAEGLRKLHEDRFDLILLDAMMPGLSGLELLERIHQIDPDIICVMITGYATVDLAAQAMKQGAHDFLPKPFTSDELLVAVQRGLEERQRRQALRKQQQREDELRQLERARREATKIDAIESRFMLVLVHELRNPAGTIKNYVQLMRSGYIDPEEQQEYLERLDRRATQLLNMLDDLLELAHLKQMPGPARMAPVAIADVLEEVARHAAPVAREKGLEFEVQIRSHPTLMGQHAHFHSLWKNLIDNAIQYTPGGFIRVTLVEQEGHVIGTVADSGIGISTEDLGRIFQEFYRSETAKTQVELGTGLGLAIVNQILKIYRGTIQVDSVPGQGSTFTFSLPTDAPGTGG